MAAYHTNGVGGGSWSDYANTFINNDTGLPATEMPTGADWIEIYPYDGLTIDVPLTLSNGIVPGGDPEGGPSFYLTVNAPCTIVGGFLLSNRVFAEFNAPIVMNGGTIEAGGYNAVGFMAGLSGTGGTFQMSGPGLVVILNSDIGPGFAFGSEDGAPTIRCSGTFAGDLSAYNGNLETAGDLVMHAASFIKNFLVAMPGHTMKLVGQAYLNNWSAVWHDSGGTGRMELWAEDNLFDPQGRMDAELYCYVGPILGNGGPSYASGRFILARKGVKAKFYDGSFDRDLVVVGYPHMAPRTVVIG